MKHIVIVCLLASSFCFGQSRKELYTVQSQNDFTTTLNLLLKTLEEKQLTIFADFDHQQNATQVGLSMPQSRVIVFGNPKVGTLLMLENPQVALDLPLRIAVVEDKNQKVHVLFPNIATLAKKYKIKNKTTLDKIQNLMQNIVQQITK